MKKRVLITLVIVLLAVIICACDYGANENIEENTEEPTMESLNNTEESATEVPEPTEESATEVPEPTEESATEAPEPTEESATEAPEPTEESATDVPEPTEESATEATEPTEEPIENLDALINPSFSSSPFLSMRGWPDRVTADEIKAIIPDIPNTQYETYPYLHNIPIDAKLYKGDEVISIALNDPRLISLMNLYNNAVCYNQYAYTQGLLDINYLEANVLNEDFRLELTFSTSNKSTVTVYDSNVTIYDTFVITNEWFVLIAHDYQGYEGMEDEYPVRSVGHSPLGGDYCWLDLFGF